MKFLKKILAAALLVGGFAVGAVYAQTGGWGWIIQDGVGIAPYFGLTLRTSGPAIEGVMYYNSTSHSFHFWNGSADTNLAGGGGAGNPCTTTALSVQYNAAGSFGCVAGVTSNGSGLTLLTIVGGSSIKPSADGTTAEIFTKADGTTAVLTLDTTNSETIAANGTAAHPSFSFAGSQTTGLYQAFANIMGIGASGVEVAAFRGTTPIGMQLTSLGQITFSSGALGAANDTGLARPLPGVLEVDTGTIGTLATINAVGYQASGIPFKQFVTSDFTTAANTSLQNITGLTWTFPANKAVNLHFRCDLYYSQATANAAVAFGVQDVTVAPTNAQVGAVLSTSTTAGTSGAATVTATTATSVVSATPSATATIFLANIDGFVEQPSNASSSAFNIMVSTATSGDAVTVKRGSFCTTF